MAFKMKYTNGKKADVSSFPFKVEGGVASDSPNKFINLNDYDFSGSGEGAAKGAAAGAMVGGPWGAVIGGLAGGIMGAKKKETTDEDLQKDIERRRGMEKSDEHKEFMKAREARQEQRRNRAIKERVIDREPKAPREETRNEEITR